MDEAQKQELIGELKDFYKELKSYKRQLYAKLSEAQKRYRKSLRERLVHKVGALKTLVIELTGKECIGRFGYTYDIWETGLTTHRVSDICDVALDCCIDATNEAIGKLEKTPLSELEPQEVSIKEPPKAFIAHKGQTNALGKLRDFLEALGVQYLIAEIEPSDGRLVEPQVTRTFADADFAIILATKGGVIDKKKGVDYMAMNVADELGRAREIFKNRTILLLETGLEPHTNISGIVHERFTAQSMDKAFIKIARELTSWGFIRAGTKQGV